MEYQIGISGLDVAQRAIDLIGVNISNASTQGYHRQELQIVPADYRAMGPKAASQGAVVQGVQRDIDLLLERERLRQQPASGQVSQELSGLQTIQSLMGQLDGQGLAGALSNFFSSLTELSAQPSSQAMQTQAVWAAQGLADQFRQAGEFLRQARDNVISQAKTTVQNINGLSQQIADLNGQIQAVLGQGGSANALQDRRDQAISDLAGLGDVEVNSQASADGTLTVTLWGTPVVYGTTSIPLEVGLDAHNQLGVTAVGGYSYNTQATGGELGGEIALANQLLPQIQGQLNTLAKTLIDRVNGISVQGVGTAGSFTSLDGVAMTGDASAPLSARNGDITDGQIHLRLIDPAGQATLYTVNVASGSDTLAGVAAKLSAVDANHFTASVANGTLHLESHGGYQFDFLPAVSSTSSLTGTAQATVGGLYTGADNTTYTAKVIGDGQVGVTQGLSLEVRNAQGELVRTLNIGLGYAPGDSLEVADGVTIRMGSGTAADADTVSVSALANSDTSGVLAAAGINTFFSGSSALDIGVRPDLLDHPEQLAIAAGAEQDDNLAITRLASLADEPMGELGGATPSDYYGQIISGLAQNISQRQAQKDNLDSIQQQLDSQRDQVSGVDVNQEAANLLVFERMFQAMSKVISVQDESIQSLLQLVQ